MFQPIPNAVQNQRKLITPNQMQQIVGATKKRQFSVTTISVTTARTHAWPNYN